MRVPRKSAVQVESKVADIWKVGDGDFVEEYGRAGLITEGKGEGEPLWGLT